MFIACSVHVPAHESNTSTISPLQTFCSLAYKFDGAWALCRTIPYTKPEADQIKSWRHACEIAILPQRLITVAFRSLARSDPISSSKSVLCIRTCGIITSYEPGPGPSPALLWPSGLMVEPPDACATRRSWDTCPQEQSAPPLRRRSRLSRCPKGQKQSRHMY